MGVAIQDIECFEVKCACSYEGTNDESTWHGRKRRSERTWNWL